MSAFAVAVGDWRDDSNLRLGPRSSRPAAARLLAAGLKAWRWGPNTPALRLFHNRLSGTAFVRRSPLIVHGGRSFCGCPCSHGNTWPPRRGLYPGPRYGEKLEPPPCFDVAGLLSLILVSEVSDKPFVRCNYCYHLFEVREELIREWTLYPCRSRSLFKTVVPDTCGLILFPMAR